MIWNVLVVKGKSGFGYQIEADSLKQAVEKAELSYDGDIVKVCLAEYDEE